jgi:hypothetical protein
MPSGLGGVLVGGLWISLAVVAAYGVVVGGWRVIGRRNEEGIGLLLTGSTALVVHPASFLRLFSHQRVEAGFGSAREHGHDPSGAGVGR